MPMQNNTKQSWLECPLLPILPSLTHEILIFFGIIFLAVISRFYDLGAHVMSHDESLHTYFSWLLYKGQGYQHTPMMHGPLQFHLLALSYFLFGVSDFTSRIPAAIFSIATILMLWFWRRYLGKAGTLFAAFLMLISPFMLFYGRYVRNEVYCGLFGILLLYSILRYLESGKKRYLYLLTTALVLNFTAKETAYIYTAQALLFLAIYLVAQITRKPWKNQNFFRGFVISLALGILSVGLALGFGIYTQLHGELNPIETSQPANPLATQTPLTTIHSSFSIPEIALILGILAFITAVVFTICGYTLEKIRSERSFDLLMLTGTLVLPLLTVFPITLLEKLTKLSIPTTAAELAALSTTGIFWLGGFVIVMFIIAIGLGLWWNAEIWWKFGLLFYGVFTVLYTTLFTNSSGFFTGLLGSLGYWLVQQGVERGSQPWYFYILVQIPIYEFLPASGSMLAVYLWLRKRNQISQKSDIDTSNNLQLEPGNDHVEIKSPLTFYLLSWWIISSLLAYTYAGEKMPWLTYHISWPMILLSGWALGSLIEHVDWNGLHFRKIALAFATLTIFLTSLSSSLLSLLGFSPPFQGKDLAQLQATGNFLLPSLVAVASFIGLTYILHDWSFGHIIRTTVLTIIGLLAILTVRTAIRASYINYNNATEYLVYAHSATSVKEVIAQAEEISRRTAGGLNAIIAYDASAPDTGVSWPFVWYLRDYTNLRSFDAPTRSLRDASIIIVDQKNFGKIEPVVGQNYYRLDYIRMWWPNQDYFGLTKDRLLNALKDPRIRSGIFNIWLNRDYRLYAEATGSQSMTLTTWEPADQMCMYIRKDIADHIWNYGVRPTVEANIPDIYEGKTIDLAADLIIGEPGTGNGQYDAPRGIAFAPDGSYYVADSRNHRIQHFNADGGFLDAWGLFADNNLAPAPIGTFNEPWGVAVGPDGSVYVTDTWNHRVQKFTATGKSLTMWGHYGLAEQPESMWGPRGIAVDTRGKVFVADTGNKRVVIFNSEGKYISQFGAAGLEPGEFDEPVGIAVSKDGTIYITDTWNQRMQSFLPSTDGLTYVPYKQWDINAWFGQSLDNKPFVAVDSHDHVFVTDPEGYRVIEFSYQGDVIQTWGDYGTGPVNFALISGIAIDKDDHIWITDSGNNRVMRFSLP